MSNKIYLLDDVGGMKEMNDAPYETESILQELVALHPELLAGDQIVPDRPRKWLLVSREMSVGDDETNQSRWSLDHLFLDQDAVPTLVEVKRSTDTRIRREVVGQMLDYAANAVVYWPIESLIASYEATCKELRVDPAEQINMACGGISEVDFWGKAKTNLQAGKIRLIFLADKVPKELRRIVEFLNEQMDPAEVFAVEVGRYRDHGGQHSAVVPVLLGNTIEAQDRKKVGTRAIKQWDKASFLEAVKTNKDAQTAETARIIIEWAENHFTRIWWGKGSNDGSCIPAIDLGNETALPFALWTYNRVEVQFQYLKRLKVFSSEAKRAELAQRMNAIKGVQIPMNALERRPTFPLDVLNDKQALGNFLATIDWAIHEFEGSQTKD